MKIEIREPNILKRFPRLVALLRGVGRKSGVPLAGLQVRVVSRPLQRRILDRLLEFTDPRGLRLSSVHARFFCPFWVEWDGHLVPFRGVIELDIDWRRCRSYRKIVHYFAHELGHLRSHLAGTLARGEDEEQAAESFALRLLRRQVGSYRACGKEALGAETVAFAGMRLGSGEMAIRGRSRRPRPDSQ